jgi:hypothetical protein
MMDQVAEAVEIVNYLSFCGPSITPELWQVFPTFCRVFIEDDGYETVENANSVVDNFVRRDTRRFVSDPSHAMLVYQMATKYLCTPCVTQGAAAVGGGGGGGGGGGAAAEGASGERTGGGSSGAAAAAHNICSCNSLDTCARQTAGVSLSNFSVCPGGAVE